MNDEYDEYLLAVKHNVSCPYQPNDSHYFKVECEGKCDNELVTKAITETKINNDNVLKMVEFWLLLLFLALSWAGMAVVVSVGDAICFTLLGDCPYILLLFRNVYSSDS